MAGKSVTAVLVTAAALVATAVVVLWLLKPGERQHCQESIEGRAGPSMLDIKVPAHAAPVQETTLQ